MFQKLAPGIAGPFHDNSSTSRVNEPARDAATRRIRSGGIVFSVSQADRAARPWDSVSWPAEDDLGRGSGGWLSSVTRESDLMIEKFGSGQRGSAGSIRRSGGSSFQRPSRGRIVSRRRVVPFLHGVSARFASRAICHGRSAWMRFVTRRGDL